MKETKMMLKLKAFFGMTVNQNDDVAEETLEDIAGEFTSRIDKVVENNNYIADNLSKEISDLNDQIVKRSDDLANARSKAASAAKAKNSFNKMLGIDTVSR